MVLGLIFESDHNGSTRVSSGSLQRTHYAWLELHATLSVVPHGAALFKDTCEQVHSL